MKIYSLTSGSKGNATLIVCDNFNILIDAGGTKKYLNASLERVGYSLNDIDMVLVTHFHTDHSKCLNCFTNEIIYSHSDEHKNLKINEDNDFYGIQIRPFELSHDERCFGYQISQNGYVYTHISDTGYFKSEYLDLVNKSDFLYLEFNHNPLILNQTRRPEFVKRRILSDKGHLNNQEAALVLVKGKDNLKELIVAHISEEANTIKAIKDEIIQVFNDYNEEITFDIQFAGHQKLVIGGIKNED